MEENIYKLKESEGKYRNFPEKNLNPVFRTSKDGILLYANPAFRRLISEEQTKIGYKVPKKWIGMIKKVYDSRKKQQTEVEVSGRVFLFDMVPVIESGYVNFYVTDITKHKNADRVVEEAYEYAESIIDTVREPLIVLDGKLRVVSVNKSFYNSFKVTPKETIGQLIYNLGNRQWNIPELRKLLEEILPNNTTFDNYKVEHDFPHIGKRIMLLNARRIPRPPAKPRIILLAIEDITNKKITQEALEETEEKFRQFFENSNDAIFIADPLTRRLVDCNKKAEKLVGRSKAEILSMQADKLHPTDMAKEAMEGFKKEVEGKAELVETEVLTKAGKRIHVEVNSSVVKISGKKYMVGIFRNITEREKAEEELIAERNKIKTYLDSLVDGVTVTDKNANITEVNKAYVEMLGYKSPSDIIGKSFTNFIVEKEIPRLSKRFTETIKNKERFIKDFEVIDKRKDGSEFPTMVNMRILWNEGKYAGCISVIRDITESKKVDEKLKESEERFRAIFEGANDGILAADAKTRRFVFANPRICEITGYSLKELLKLGLGDINPKKDLPYVIDSFEKQMQGKLALSKDIPVLRKDGRVIYCDVNSKSLKIGGQEYLVGIFRDVTERKKMEEESETEKKKLVNLIEGMPVGVYIADLTGKLVAVNKVAEQQTGYKRSEIIGNMPTMFAPKRELPKYTAILKRVMKKGIVKNVELIVKCKDGTELSTLNDTALLKDANDKPIEIVLIVRDITEHKEAEEKLKESEEKYKLIFEEANDGILVADIKTKKFIFANPKICEITGYTLKELLRLDVTGIHPKKELPYVLDQFKKQIEGKIIIAKDIPVLRKDKKIVFCDVNSRNTSIKGQKCLVGFFRDITERKKAEEEIHSKELLLKNIIDSSPDIIFVKDTKLRTLVCNKAYASAVGKTPEEVIGKTDIENGWKPELVHGNPAKGIRGFENDDKIALKGNFVHNPNDPANIGKKILIFDTYKLPLYDDEHNIIGVLGLARNVTERKKVEEELKISEARYRSYIEATKQLGWTTDAKGLIIEDIPTWRAYTGQSFEKIKNWGWIKAIHPDDAKHTAEVWEKAVKTKSIYETEYRIRGKDGKYRWFLARGVPVLEDGSIREWVGTCIDISERIKTEEEIKKARDDFQLKVEELEKFNKLTIGRELKMIELKRRIKELEYELKKKENKLI